MFHCYYGHVSNRQLNATARKMEETSDDDFRPCVRCSMSNGLCKPITSSTNMRATNTLGRVFVDLIDTKSASALLDGEQHIVIVCDDYFVIPRCTS